MAVAKKFLLSSILLCIVFVPSIAFAKNGSISGNNVNIRSGPGINFGVIDQANEGEHYPIIQEKGEWIEVQLSNGTGWIINSYIDISHPQESEATTSVSPPSTITIANNHTQIRSGPSTDEPIEHFAKKGSVFNVLSVDGDWYEIQNDEVHGYLLQALADPINLPTASRFFNKTIVIDAGHGGRDVGAIGVAETFEKDIALLTAMELKQELTMLGADVRLTRTSDEFIPLGSRISFSNLVATDAFISIHYNSVPESPTVSGIETYYYQDYNDGLASQIQSELVKATGANDRGTSFGDFLVLRQSLKASVLLELGFISNQEQESLLDTTAYQKKLVSGIVNGLASYFASNER
ncbi:MULTISPECIES: N-acetylmuramoyl-L-alanine amidase [Virgibacillus]|uniref:N-acetylmuramoyl-L-alanine amidase n=1 Tax=Virgibacillus TaxID=84406 RepID=UPI0003882246|nr:N-acetylmuramoyl-L-alanine amidase [Virgibacillus sp. CM-4]EQB35858.1 hypothetical protein M948_12525 [Virgibacillus sp. CM-4]